MSFFSKIWERFLLNLEKISNQCTQNPARFLEIGANVAIAAVSRNPRAALSTLPEVFNFYRTGKGLYLGKFV